MAEEVKSNCPRCGDTRERLYTKKVQGGYVRFCHNANCYKDDSFVRDKQQSPTDIIQQANLLHKTQESFEYENKLLELPWDFSTELSRECILWLSKYNITSEEVREFNIGFSKRMNRLILPVYNEDGVLIYYQGRNLGNVSKHNPKYLNVRQIGAKNVYFNNYTRAVESPNALFIVEDILSAIKVGRVYKSKALLGSYFPKDFYSTIPLDIEAIYIWLDDDKYLTALAEAKRLKLLTNKFIRVIKTQQDPKCYDAQYIKELI
jgi:hypothetical protein